MVLTREEKEVLYVYGCSSFANTRRRLGMVCMLMVDPVTKANACSLRNKLVELDCQLRYYFFYAEVLKNLAT